MKSHEKSVMAEGKSPTGLFAEIRSSCSEVTGRAAFVQIDGRGLEELADRLAEDGFPEDDFDPASNLKGTNPEKVAFVITLDAINFGSGWFPALRKHSGMSGYRTIATACKARFESQGSWSGEMLREASAESMAELLGQDLRAPLVAELMGLYARAWRELGVWLGNDYDDRFVSVVEEAGHSAERLVESLAKMSLYRDVSSYEEIRVPFYKRAQITAADLNRTFGDSHFGGFDDLAALTLFADNLVPHVLRCEGVLKFDASLVERIDAGELLANGSKEEVEIRAVAVEAVERLVVALAERRSPTTAHVIDGLLWNAGQSAKIKANPRHRTRTSYY